MWPLRGHDGAMAEYTQAFMIAECSALSANNGEGADFVELLQ
jgi:hypothetical protein